MNDGLVSATRPAGYSLKEHAAVSVILTTFIFILGQNMKRESGRKVQLGNINAAKVSHLFIMDSCSLGLQTCICIKLTKIFSFVFQTIADVIRTCLGPRAMMKVCNNECFSLGLSISCNSVDFGVEL